ncbi:unnamed protein product [Effrenium voratum]|uniref:S1 motif domain-containing protein n=1 Tax=Effrenium voratum TaxID=2562239 RepID=A0AA36N6A7_9DINO|nr:unnamed protein product [Effrenium voratum]
MLEIREIRAALACASTSPSAPTSRTRSPWPLSGARSRLPGTLQLGKCVPWSLAAGLAVRQRLRCFARSLESEKDLDQAIASLLAQRVRNVRESRRVPVSSLKVGRRLTGIVRDIVSFGVFVDVGAQRDGLVPTSLLSEKYVTDVYEEVMPGQKVTVWVAEVKENGQLSLAMFPWHRFRGCWTRT